MIQFKTIKRTASVLVLLLGTGLAGQSFAADDASDAKKDLAREYLALTNQLASAEDIAQAVGRQIIRQRPDIRITVENSAEAVAKDFDDEVNSMNEEVVRVYTDHFSEEELQSLVDSYKALYATPAGKKLKADSDAIAEKMGEISRVRGVAIGGEIYKALIEEVSKREQPVGSKPKPAEDGATE
ncbi:DUF2059 domain-containing protein [Methyloligella sp. 2.7D]|uniref:DUF2059 domain-containing protein n=1 Tax=unclassified Methyloligella TaxID=2625955 RepID=UPI00157C8F6D|nr:DUF2059 domain-containing protein [Methyloligella sp. GL2]QKP77189.1 DUF2059 domain-containing protein [Methyloligella sp. GL2]